MSKSYHILIVEDEHSIAELYKTKLQLNSYEVTIATNGVDALRQLKQTVPDLLLVDLRMPVMDGETLVDRIRNKLYITDLPIIVLTNISKEEAPRTLWHHGINDYFVKAHHTPADLVERINKVLVESAKE